MYKGEGECQTQTHGDINTEYEVCAGSWFWLVLLFCSSGEVVA